MKMTNLTPYSKFIEHTLHKNFKGTLLLLIKAHGSNYSRGQNKRFYTITSFNNSHTLKQ